MSSIGAGAATPGPRFKSGFDPGMLSGARVGGRPYAVVLVFALLGILTPLQLYSGIEQPGETSLNFLLCLAILEICAVRIALLVAEPPRFLTLTFYFYLYIWIGWSGGLQTYLWIFPWRLRHDHDDLTAALGQIFLVIIAYELGQLMARRRWRARASQPRETPNYQLSIDRLVVVWLFSFAGFAYGVAFFGIDTVLGTAKTFGHGSFDTSQTGFVITRSLLRVPCFVAFVAAAHLILYHWRAMSQSQRRLIVVILVTSAGVTFIANYPPAVARSWLGVVLMTPVMLLAPWGRRASLFWVLALMFVLTWVYPRSDLFRYATNLDEALRDLRMQQMAREHVLSNDFSELQMTVNHYRYVQENDYMWGSNLLGAALFFVPRSVWPSKPQRSDLIVANAIGYRQTNLSASFWSEGYLAFGLPGLVTLLLVYGYASRWIEQRYVWARLRGQIATLGPIALLVPFWGAYQFYFLRGNLITAVGYSALPLALMWFLYIRRKPAIATAP